MIPLGKTSYARTYCEGHTINANTVVLLIKEPDIERRTVRLLYAMSLQLNGRNAMEDEYFRPSSQ